MIQKVERSEKFQRRTSSSGDGCDDAGGAAYNKKRRSYDLSSYSSITSLLMSSSSVLSPIVAYTYSNMISGYGSRSKEKSMLRTRPPSLSSSSSSSPSTLDCHVIPQISLPRSIGNVWCLTTSLLYVMILFMNCFTIGYCDDVNNGGIQQQNNVTTNTSIGNNNINNTANNHDQIINDNIVKSSVRNASVPVDYPSPRQASSTERLVADNLQIIGLRVEASTHEILVAEDGIPEVLCDTEITVRIFGTGITEETIIAFTPKQNDYGGSCMFPTKTFYKALPGSVSFGATALYKVVLPKESSVYYVCAKNDISGKEHPFVHQGKDKFNEIHTYTLLLPLWASILVILTCLGFSALFSGLNLGLMSMDRTELKILCNTGTAREQEYAQKIQPVRDHGNYLLCSILLGNVLVNSLFTILLDGLTSGLIAVIFSTLAIVIFGEITPQAVCSRHGLAIGAKTINITKTVMLLTFPLSYPTSKVLDWALGEEIGNVYNRERLKELVKVTTGINDLDKTEVNIISGALELRKKTVADVMTHIEDAFMLPLDATLDFETVSEIMKTGYSRIPVYDGDKKNIVTLLYIKDLAFVDTDDNTPLRTLCEFYQNPVHFVFEDCTLDIMFSQFKEGSYGHIAFVNRVNTDGDCDPFYETIGLVTLEDVIEELIQAEIVDETDVFVDNRTKVRRKRNKKQDFTIFAERREYQTIRISPQLTLATFQYLSTAVDAFKRETISETILRRLLNQDIIHAIKCKGKEKDDPSLFIFQQGQPVDFFVLILEGRVEVTVGKENLLFESGPFTYFGVQALVANIVMDSPTQPQLMGSLQSLNIDEKLRQTFVPDYSVRAASDVIYIAIPRSLYLTAKKATLLEKSRKSGTEPSGEAIDYEVEKLLHSLNEDEKYVRGAQTVRKISGVNGSKTVSPSLNESMAAAAHLNSQGSNSADLVDGVSLSSQITSDHNNENHHADHEYVARTPLLAKPETTV